MKTALVIDDDRASRLIVSIHLKRHDFSVEHASNGKEAVKMASQQKYELIIIDMHMPLMNGIDAVLAIRAIEIDNGWERAPIFAFTSDDSVETLMMEAGADEFMIKPLCLPNLEKAILRFCGKA